MKKLSEILDTSVLPLADPRFRADCKAALDREGALVLHPFLQPAAIASIQHEGRQQQSLAFYTTNTHNIYLTPPDAGFSHQHPRNRQISSSKGCITDDQVPTDSALRTLYNASEFRSFLCAVLDEPALHAYADPLSSINLHYAREGQELGWHFDNSSFAITLMVQTPAGGGEFEYVKDVRDADAGEMNYDASANVLDGQTPTQTLTMQEGALVLFRGRNSMHRVTPVTGDRTRMLVVLAYNTKPDVALVRVGTHDVLRTPELTPCVNLLPPQCRVETRFASMRVRAADLASSKTVLLTLGRLPKALELTRGLHRAGCRVIVAEPFDWHVCRISNSVDKSVALPSPNEEPDAYRQALLDTINEDEVDLVIPVSEEALHTLSVQDSVADHVQFFSPPRDTILALHDKLRFARDAIAEDFTVPPTFELSDSQAQALIEQHDVIVKPSHGCSGVGVQHLGRGTALPALPGHIAQRYIEGRHISTFSLANSGRTCATALYEGTLLSGTVAVCFKRVHEHAAITRWVERFIELRALDGFVSFDFIVDADNIPWAIECNPRVTSGIHFLNDDDLAAAILDPQGDHPVRFRQREHFQQFYPALTETYKYLFKPRTFARKFATLFKARDVVWNARDPWPFLMMTPASWPILRQTIFEGKSFGDAATHDIAWHDDASAELRDT